MSTDNNSIRLTHYSRGAGCGCKIAPQVLKEILQQAGNSIEHRQLLVGNQSNDDAAVYDLGGGQALICTTDFFMPIVDDAFDYGRVAAANALSDVYAMGGKPIVALAILGWPVDKLPAELAARVMQGGLEMCRQAGIPLAGGHSIDSPEPIFGLAVNGLVTVENLKRNNTARDGDILFLTKALGTGIISTAIKKDLAGAEDAQMLVNQITQLNTVGYELGKIRGVHAMTDVTGFGLLGHLIQMADSSALSAEIYYPTLKKIPAVEKYLPQNILPDATYRNWNAYSNALEISPGVNAMEAFQLLPDPQTNGGLLIAVDQRSAEDVKTILTAAGLGEFTQPIGRMIKKNSKTVYVNPLPEI